MSDATCHPQTKVLVVDDDVDTCELYSLMLAPLGYHVTCVYDGEAALEKLRSEPFDVAVIDLSLHKLDGRSVAREARAALGDRTPPLIAVSGWGGADHHAASRAAGFAEHHLKPLAPADLAASIGRFAGPTRTA